MTEIGSIADVVAPVADSLARVNAELFAELLPADSELLPLIEHVGHYRGKQLRPTLVLLAGRACGELTDEHVTVAKVVELIHTATLVHDDILDGASLRRQLPTVNALHGNEVPVLLGDYIYARAFQLSVGMRDQECSRVLSSVTRTICQGEITQILHRFDFDWTEERYFRVIEEKTASLYGAACRLGGHYSRARPEQLEALHAFGIELGIAFQIVDDCLDLDGEESVVGKTLGSDLDKGKLTLPLLRLLAEEPAALRRLLAPNAPTSRLAKLRENFDLEAAIDYAMGHAERGIERALARLALLPASAARDAMATIARYVLTRRV